MSNTFVPSPPQFYADKDKGTLLCPSCGNRHTHHTSVAVYNRPEDAETGRRTVAADDATTIDDDMTGNPSGRRDGLVISFYCETCPTIMELAVYQHKGETFFQMRHKMDKENDPRDS